MSSNNDESSDKELETETPLKDILDLLMNNELDNALVSSSDSSDSYNADAMGTKKWNGHQTVWDPWFRLWQVD